ncbi:MAG: DUF4126 domain-containing protein [Desulfobulbaceae bacterium]|uniref:DUF4126 domain-containing protein n=1 Tax=Candidatus Desulfatifera sulfidica TaxID=2841691 RepID=A0A8J6N750_9BACT|nr:DUF4126 domain-containing protein [Candidatus Desulfatifera sulfidica]
MDAYQQLIDTIALTLGSAWGAGINLYATIGVLGLLGASGHIILPETLQVVQDPLVITAACLMYAVEFFADKTPGLDTGWDAIHSFIRIPAGVILAAGAVGDMSPALVIAAGILGGTISATSHTIKAGSRVLINTSPEPFSNWAASVTEDVAVIGGIWTALNYPLIFIILFICFIILAIWVIPKIWIGIKGVINWLRRLLGKKDGFAPDTLDKTTPPTQPHFIQAPDQENTSKDN